MASIDWAACFEIEAFEAIVSFTFSMVIWDEEDVDGLADSACFGTMFSFSIRIEWRKGLGELALLLLIVFST